MRIGEECVLMYGDSGDVDDSGDALLRHSLASTARPQICRLRANLALL